MAERRIINGYIVERAPDGTLTTIGPANQQPQMPANPAYTEKVATLPYAAPQAGANLDKTRTDIGKTQTDIADTGADNSREDLKIVADLFKQGLRPDGRGGVEVIPNWTPPPGIEKPQTDLTNRAARLNSLAAQINRVQQLYSQDIGPEPYGIFSSLGDYLPMDENSRFDVAGTQLSEKGLAAFRVPGTGTVTDRDAVMFERANMPSAATRDVAIEEQLRGMRERVDQERAALGLPPVSWEGQEDRRDPIAAANIPGGNAPTGGQMQLAQPGGPFTTPQDLALAAAVEKAYRSGGNLNALVAAAKASGYEPTLRDVAGWREAIDYRDQTGKFVAVQPRASGQQGEVAAALGRAAMNPVGTAVAQYANSATLGVPEALAGSEGFEALGDLNPTMGAIGQIGGAITGTGAIAKGGRAALGGIAPNLFRGGKAGQFGRGLATDATYGAGYGGITGDNPLATAGAAGVGSAVGQVAASGLGRMGSGILNPTAKYLADKNIPMTVGQALGEQGLPGRIIKGVEDRAAGFVGLGDLINARRTESLEGFNLAMFSDGLKPINATVSNIAEEGVDQARAAKSRYYDSVLNPVPPIPVDARLAGSMVNAKGMGNRIPGMGEDVTYSVDRAMENVGPIGIDGRGYQSARQRLGEAMRALPQKDGIRGADAAGVLGDARDELDAFIGRSAGPQVVEGLGRANAANRNISVIEDAVRRARNGARSGEAGLVVPSQLNDAAVANARKFGGSGTNRPFYELGKAGQRLLPSKVPDSGTAGRLGLASLPALLGATGGGSGYVNDGSLTGALQGSGSGLAAGAALTALLAAGGTKAGQKALVKALTDRPASVRAFGRKIRKQKGLFGSAASPFFIEQVD